MSAPMHVFVDTQGAAFAQHPGGRTKVGEVARYRGRWRFVDRDRRTDGTGYRSKVEATEALAAWIEAGR